MLKEKIIEFKNINKLNDNDCANKLGISIETLLKIESGENINKEEENRILKIINNEKPSGKRIIKILDLIFRFVAMVMALVTLLLCINENVDTKVLVVLLSIGLVCSSMTILPKIEK